MSPEPPERDHHLPRLGSKFRYSGRTQYQTRMEAAQSDRPSPQFRRALSGRAVSSRSMDREWRRQTPAQSGTLLHPAETADWPLLLLTAHSHWAVDATGVTMVVGGRRRIWLCASGRVGGNVAAIVNPA